MIQAASRRGLALAILIFASLCCAASPIDVGGARLDDAVQLGGSPLLLNGAGVRYRALFKVYAAGLYLGAKAASTQEVLAMAGPKRLALVMLRDVDANELDRLFARGVADNAPRHATSQLIPGLLRMSQIFSDQKELKAGDSIQIDWLPATGTVITIKGDRQGTPIREQAFFEALLGIWLGPAPADWKLKDALLGKG